MSQPQILLDLTKSFELNLDKAGVTTIPTLEVLLAVDKSGSMDGLYRQGFVDSAINLFLPLALKFDDNSQIEVGFFNQDYHEAPFAVPEDCGKYLAKAGVRADGGTNFAPIIEAFETNRSDVSFQTVTKTVTQAAKGIWGKLTGKTEQVQVVEQIAVPVQGKYRSYAAIVTDGANFDKRDFEEQMRRTSGNTFYQFIGIGNGVETAYLTEIANKYNHVAYFELRDPTKITADDFYSKIVNAKFTAWM